VQLLGLGLSIGPHLLKIPEPLLHGYLDSFHFGSNFLAKIFILIFVSLSQKHKPKILVGKDVVASRVFVNKIYVTAQLAVAISTKYYRSCSN